MSQPPAPRLANRSANRIGGFLRSLGVAGFIGAIFVMWQWLRRTPLSPDPERGFVHAFNDHGTVHYLTSVQNIGFHGLLVACALVVIVGSAITPKRKVPKGEGVMGLSAHVAPDDPDGVRWPFMAFGALLAALVAFGLYLVGR